MKGRSGVAFTPGSPYFRASFEVPSPLGEGLNQVWQILVPLGPVVDRKSGGHSLALGQDQPWSSLSPALPIPQRVRTSITPSIHSRTFPKGHAQAQGCPVLRAFLLVH